MENFQTEFFGARLKCGVKYTDKERKTIEDCHPTKGTTFSASKIEPLNLDLASLPIVNSSIDSDGILSDGRCINIRLKYGWLTVRIGPVGVDEEIVREVYVGFRGRLHPEQACEILGLTVGGEEVVPSDEILKKADWDFSGRTTYLRTDHQAFVEDADEFVKLLMDVYPGACLLRDNDGLKVVTRIIEDPIKFSTKYIIGIGANKKILDTNPLAADADFSKIFNHHIDLSFRRSFNLENLQTNIAKECVGKALIDYEVIHHGSLRIGMNAKTDDAIGMSFLNKLSELTEGYFCKGTDNIDLFAPLNVLSKDDNKSYSERLRNWCLFKPNRYLDIQILKDIPAGKTILSACRPIG